MHVIIILSCIDITYFFHYVTTLIMIKMSHIEHMYFFRTMSSNYIYYSVKPLNRFKLIITIQYNVSDYTCFILTASFISGSVSHCIHSSYSVITLLLLLLDFSCTCLNYFLSDLTSCIISTHPGIRDNTERRDCSARHGFILPRESRSSIDRWKLLFYVTISYFIATVFGLSLSIFYAIDFPFFVAS